MKKKNGKRNLRTTLQNILLVIAGTLVLSFGTAVFILPFNLVTGGVSGISIVINNLFPGVLHVDTWVTIITWSLFLLGLFFLGRSFAAKTLLSTILYPLGVSLFLKVADPEFLGGFFCLQASSHGELSLILACAFGGTCVGLGCALTFIGGGSTGGVDIIAFTVCKIFKRAKSSVVLFIIDAVIVLSGMFVIGDFVLTLLGVLSAFVSAMMVDKVFIGSSKSFVAQIITDRYLEINRDIIERVDRTSTIVDVIGGYSGENKKMLIVSFTVNQYAEILNTINKYDKNAFVTIQQVHEINGEGWTR